MTHCAHSTGSWVAIEGQVRVRCSTGDATAAKAAATSHQAACHQVRDALRACPHSCCHSTAHTMQQQQQPGPPPGHPPPPAPLLLTFSTSARSSARCHTSGSSCGRRSTRSMTNSRCLQGALPLAKSGQLQRGWQHTCTSYTAGRGVSQQGGGGRSGSVCVSIRRGGRGCAEVLCMAAAWLDAACTYTTVGGHVPSIRTKCSTSAPLCKPSCTGTWPAAYAPRWLYSKGQAAQYLLYVGHGIYGSIRYAKDYCTARALPDCCGCPSRTVTAAQCPTIAGGPEHCKLGRCAQLVPRPLHAALYQEHAVARACRQGRGRGGAGPSVSGV